MNDLTRMLVLGFLNGITFLFYMSLAIPERDWGGRLLRVFGLSLSTAAMLLLIREALGAS